MNTLHPSDDAGPPRDKYSGIVASTLAFRIADRAAVHDIEIFAAECGRDAAGRPVYDTRPMLDEREHSPDCVEMATQAIAYAASRGLIRATSEATPHHVAIVRMPT